MPVTVLFGRSPSGLNATGESDRIGWYDTVQAHRDYVILPRGQTLLRLVCLALGVDPDGWVLECPALLQESDKDYAARQKIVADTDSVYLAAEVLRPEEVALARYGRGEWSDTAPQIDTESRETMLKIDLERVQSGGEEVGPQRLTPSGEAGVPPTKADPTSPESPDYDPETETATGEEAPPETPAANAAFNGAQTASLVSIVTAVASGDLPASSAIEILLVAFPITREQAERMIGPAEEMTPAEPEVPVPVPPAFGAAPFEPAPEPAPEEEPEEMEETTPTHLPPPPAVGRAR